MLGSQTGCCQRIAALVEVLDLCSELLKPILTLRRSC